MTLFKKWADTIKAFRTEQGILTGIVTLQQTGGNTATIIENYINNAYNTWDIPPVAVLLMADYGTDANNSITSRSGITIASPIISMPMWITTICLRLFSPV